ncbi:acyltransferase domain-containing protein [Streptomyces albus]|uniref:acyltransferase domain-containing protein n=1 Tax=Streptomyces albus TaxID=1888 RepID=UPI0032AEF14B
MAALAAAEEEVLPLLDGLADRIAVAAVNGPQATVVSGDTSEVERVSAYFSELGRKTRNLRVSHAFHSPHMDAMLEDFARSSGTSRCLRRRSPWCPTSRGGRPRPGSCARPSTG